MGMMTRQEALLFKERWQYVNEFTSEEARQKTVAERLRDLEMLYQFGQEMGWTRQEDDEQQVWARWNRIREKAGV